MAESEWEVMVEEKSFCPFEAMRNAEGVAHG
jgi:hypothetical protein